MTYSAEPGYAVRRIALSGGVGGAKLAAGLARIGDPRDLMIVANTGDDFVHLGLAISPDIDTLVYTLAGLANPETGWGRADETWSFMETLAALGGETWFNLGDRDLAMHVERTRRLNDGETLSDITDDVRIRLGIAPRIVPMSDDRVRTVVDTAGSPLAFQHYFVRDACRPVVTGLRFQGAENAQPAEALITALGDPALEAIILCPSNPLISIAPILAVPGIRNAIERSRAPVVAVSPIIAGRAVKGPTAKMMEELGMEVSAIGIARHYQGLIDGFVLDEADAGLAGAVRETGAAVRVARTLMDSTASRIALAREVGAFTAALAR